MRKFLLGLVLPVALCTGMLTAGTPEEDLTASLQSIVDESISPWAAADVEVVVQEYRVADERLEALQAEFVFGANVMGGVSIHNPRTANASELPIVAGYDQCYTSVWLEVSDLDPEAMDFLVIDRDLISFLISQQVAQIDQEGFEMDVQFDNWETDEAGRLMHGTLLLDCTGIRPDGVTVGSQMVFDLQVDGTMVSMVMGGRVSAGLDAPETPEEVEAQQTMLALLEGLRTNDAEARAVVKSYLDFIVMAALMGQGNLF